MTPEFQTFLKTGDLPKSMSARSKILDIARHEILSLTSPQNMTKFVLNPATGVREAVEVDYSTRHFRASSFAEVEEEAAKIKVLANQARGLTKPRSVAPAKPTASTQPGVVHRAATPAPFNAVSIAAAVVNEQERRSNQDVLSKYEALQAGPVKRAFLAEHGVEIVALAKSREAKLRSKKA